MSKTAKSAIGALITRAKSMDMMAYILDLISVKSIKNRLKIVIISLENERSIQQNKRDMRSLAER